MFGLLAALCVWAGINMCVGWTGERICKAAGTKANDSAAAAAAQKDAASP